MPVPRRVVTGHDARGRSVVLSDEPVGAEVAVRAGDIVVQRGTDHAWVNRSGGTARVAFVLVDGAFEPGLPPPPA